MIPKRELTFILPHIGKTSLDLRTRLRETIDRTSPYCKMEAVFRSYCRGNTFFHFKNLLEKKI